MATIDIKKLYIALCHDNADGETYDAPEYVEGVQQFSAKPKQNTASLYEEGRQVDQDNTLQDIEISFDIGHMSNIQIAKYLGHHVASGGGTYALADDVAPYVALLYKYEKNARKADGTHACGYKIYYKGMLTEPDETAKQKEGKTDYQNHTVTATFQPCKGHNNIWKYTVDEDDANCPVGFGDTFFNSVIIPSEDITAPTVTSVPTDATTGVTASSSVAFTFNKAMDPSTLNSDNLFLMKADGTIVATTLVIDSAQKVVSLTPVASMATGSYIAVCTTNVKSVSGVKLATQEIVNFTV